VRTCEGFNRENWFSGRLSCGFGVKELSNARLPGICDLEHFLNPQKTKPFYAALCLGSLLRTLDFAGSDAGAHDGSGGLVVGKKERSKFSWQASLSAALVMCRGIRRRRMRPSQNLGRDRTKVEPGT